MTRLTSVGTGTLLVAMLAIGVSAGDAVAAERTTLGEFFTSPN